VKKLIALMGPLLSSCAITYTDAQGDLHRVGFFAERTRIEGELLIRSDQALGVRLDASNKGAGFTLGYREKTDTYFIEAPEPICLVQRQRYFRKVECPKL
jgi:hypothetical protein